MTDRTLSPAAKAILEAYDNSPFEYDTGDLTACAAVLRAAVDQLDDCDGLLEGMSLLKRIAAELEGGND